MIDEKYRIKRENITDFLEKEKFRYIKIFEINTQNTRIEEIEQCDVIVEKLEEIKEGEEKFYIYKIKEENHLYETEYIKEKILENFIFDELIVLVDKNFELIEILNIDEIYEKCEVVQNEVKKIENIDLKLTFAMVENLKELVKNEERFSNYMKQERFYNIFYNDLKQKEIELKGIIPLSIPVRLSYEKDKEVDVINGEMNYLRNILKIEEEMEKKYKKKARNLKLEYGRYLIIDEYKITKKVDSMIKLYDKTIEDKKEQIVYFKREFLERF